MSYTWAVRLGWSNRLPTIKYIGKYIGMNSSPIVGHNDPALNKSLSCFRLIGSVT